MASRFWVGGSATWDGTAGAKWSTTSGGSSGAAVPTAADDVFFDASSGANTITTSGTTVDLCRSLNCTGFTGTLSHAAATTITIGDATAGASSVALKLVAGMTYTKGNADTSAISFVSTSATVQTIDSGGKTLGNLTFNGVAGSWQLTTANTIAATSTLTLTAGTLDTNGQACSWGLFVPSGSLTKVLTLGASTISITGTSGTVWNASNGATGMTLNAGTSTIQFTSTNTLTHSMATFTYNNISIAVAGSKTFTGAFTCNNFTHTPGAANNVGLVFQANPVINGVFTVTGANSATNAGRIILTQSLPTISGGRRTITVNGSYSFTNVDFNYIAAAGSATLPWTGTSMGDAGNCSNITFDSPRTLYWFGAASNWNTLNKWFTATGGGGTSGTAPLPQDDCIIDANSAVTASGSFNSSLRYIGRNINFTGVPNAATLTFQLGAFNCALTGSLTWATGMTLANGGASANINFGFDTRNVTLTHNGCTPSANFGYLCGGTGSLTLSDDLSMVAGIIWNQGTFDANGKNVTVGGFSSSNSNTRTITMGSGTWTLTGTGVVFNMATITGLTFSGASATVLVTDTSAALKTIEHRQTVNKIGIMTLSGGSGICQFSGAYYGVLTFAAGGSYMLPTSGTLKTDSFVAIGTAGNLITIQSGSSGVAAPGSPSTISQASGVVRCDYLSIRDSTASGGAQWFAGANSTNTSGNTGWMFRVPSFGAFAAFFF